MKIFTKILVLAAVLFFAACSKANMDIVDVFGDPAVLMGKWKLSETLADPGDGSGQWRKVSRGTDDYIVFGIDGKLSGNAFKEYSTYAVQDSVTLQFKKADGVTYQNYRFQLQGGALSMSPAGPIMCIEACGIRFKKVE
ncbi:MAG TPA: hypothetical protein VLZ28_08915 [Daejeonella sp.]|nr:hypothetical protein [Daejeonella sp.]